MTVLKFGSFLLCGMNAFLMQKDKMRILLCYVCLVVFLSSRCAEASDVPVEEIAKRALDATVLLLMYDANDELSAVGSGFFVKKTLLLQTST